NSPASAAENALSSGSTLAIRHSLAETAARFHASEDAVRAVLETSRQRLLAARAARPRPARDDKVIVAWNGMMVSALARAAQVFDEPRYLDAARTAAAFIQSRMSDGSSGALKRRYRQGDADIDAVLEDYVFLTQ